MFCASQFVYRSRAFSDVLRYSEFPLECPETFHAFHCLFRIAVFHSDILCSSSFAYSLQTADLSALQYFGEHIFSPLIQLVQILRYSGLSVFQPAEIFGVWIRRLFNRNGDFPVEKVKTEIIADFLCGFKLRYAEKLCNKACSVT